MVRLLLEVGLGPTFCFRVSAMRTNAALEALIEPVVSALGYELVGIEHLSQGRRSLLRLYIDSEQGITLDDCERVSHQVSGVLDVEEPLRGDYTLEVSSPGLDRPLFKPEHYARFVGHRVRLRLHAPLNGRRNYSGVIEGVAGDDVLTLETDDDGRLELPLRDIDKANLVPEF